MLLTSQDTLQLVTGGTAATHVTVDYFDRKDSGGTPGRQRTVITSAATTAIGDAPGNGFRQVRGVRIANASGSASQTVTVQITDGTTVVRQIYLTLQANEQLVYESESGWFVVDAAGGRKDAASVGRYLATTLLTAGTEFTTGAETNTIKLRMVGGGAAGGGVTNVGAQAAAGGGGGAGAYAERTFAVSPNTVYTYAIGAGGAGVAEDAGANGGDTTFSDGTTTVTAPGGTGGPQAAASAALTANLGGAGGAVPTNGDVNVAGNPGEPGVILIVAGPVGVSGKGGSSPFGAGAIGLTAAGAGTAAADGFGAGGSGALRNGAAGTGGAGTDGAIVVEEYA